MLDLAFGLTDTYVWGEGGERRGREGRGGEREGGDRQWARACFCTWPDGFPPPFLHPRGQTPSLDPPLYNFRLSLQCVPVSLPHACPPHATHRSRLGCQVITSKEIDGIRVRIPSASRNFYVSAEGEVRAGNGGG